MSLFETARAQVLFRPRGPHSRSSTPLRGVSLNVVLCQERDTPWPESRGAAGARFLSTAPVRTLYAVSEGGQAQPTGLKRGLRRLSAWVGGNPVPFLTLLGALWYALTTVSFSAFYVELGLTPSEVGITYADTLVRAVAALPVLVLAWAFFFVLFTAFSVAWAGVAAGWRQRNKPDREPPLVAERDYRRRLAAYGLGTVIFALFLAWPELSRDLAGEVKDGEAVTPGFLSWTNPLGLRAQPARIIWLEGSPPTGLEGLAGEPLLYLGQASGMLVLFNPATDQALRVPSGAVVLSVSD
jgi:hypothetical protein